MRSLRSVQRHDNSFQQGDVMGSLVSAPVGRSLQYPRRINWTRSDLDGSGKFATRWA